jgi:hypothetical protein
MKKLLLPMAMILLVATGCLLTPAGPNQPPTAYIDSVSPTNVAPGETVTFTGHGIDPDGTVGAYSWRSSRDGDLSTAPSFSTSSLSPGTHTIWFKVQDDDGVWSNEVLATVIVVPAEATKPVINYFNASPGIISPSGSSTISWDVSGAATVSIDQQIGNVGLSGTRVVFPTATTTYTLTATNTVGTVKSTAQVTVASIPINKIELSSLAAEDGYVTHGGYVGQGAIVGYTANGMGVQGFLSFDISVVPKGVIIKSVSIDLDAGAVQVNGEPFEKMGRLNISKCTYGQLKTSSYFIGPTSDAICSFARWPENCINSSLTISALQEQLDAGSNRFQVRMSFAHAPDAELWGARWSERWDPFKDNYLDFSQAKPKLVIEYE